MKPSAPPIVRVVDDHVLWLCEPSRAPSSSVVLVGGDCGANVRNSFTISCISIWMFVTVAAMVFVAFAREELATEARNVCNEMAKLEYDKSGIPQYDGTPDRYEEYQERAWDAFHSWTGDERQASIPVKLRTGLTSLAYDAARNLAHTDLIAKKEVDKKFIATEDGMKLLLSTLGDAVLKEKKVRAAELFDSVLYDKGVWRAHGEPMPTYIARRVKAFDDIKKVSSNINVSLDLQAHLLLRFSGIDENQKAAVINSAGNKYDRDEFAKALRMQHATLHEKERKKATYRDSGDRHQRPWKTSRQAWPVEPDQLPAQAFEEESTYGDSPASAENESEDESVMDQVNIADLDDMDPEAAESFAAIAQHRRRLAGKGRGKGKEREPPFSRPYTQAYARSPSRSSTGDAQNLRERKEKVAALKKVTRCAVCGQIGHWYKDPSCPKAGQQKNASSIGSRRPTYFFAVSDYRAGSHGVKQAFMQEKAGKSTCSKASSTKASSSKAGSPEKKEDQPGPEAKKEKGKNLEVMDAPCDHCRAESVAIQRGANGFFDTWSTTSANSMSR